MLDPSSEEESNASAKFVFAFDSIEKTDPLILASHFSGLSDTGMLPRVLKLATSSHIVLARFLRQSIDSFSV
jgi:hypothetical protein